MATEYSPPSPIPRLTISLAHKPCSSPPVIIAAVTNTNSYDVTVVNYNSPFDDLLVQLGISEITPEGASEPINYPTIQVKRVWPPPKESTVGLAPGESKETDITLSDPPISLEGLKGQNVTVDLKGNWMGVLKKAKEDVSEGDWDGNELFKGGYISPLVKFTIE